LRELLEQFSKEKLVDFMIGYAEKDMRFTNALQVSFCNPEPDKDLSRISNELSAMFEDAPYHGHGGWGYIDFDASEVFAEIKQRMEQGHIRLAFSEAKLIYRKLLENFEYQEECEISDEAERCLDMMSEIADRVISAEDGDYIFRQCLELSDIEDGRDYGADYEDKLLRIAAKHVTPENLSDLESALKSFDSGWREEELKLIRLEVIRKIEGEDATSAFLSENSHFSKIREIAFDQAISRKDFEEAERLCIDAISLYKQHYGVSPWLYKLYSVYDLTENVAGMATTAEEILLAGDLKYYDILKILQNKQGLWDYSYPILLEKCKKQLSYQQYMEILEIEKESTLLLDQLKIHPEQIYLYGKTLSAQYPTDISRIFTAQIEKEAETAYGREAYSSVCTHILFFAQAGYHIKPIEMIDEFKLKYKRKPAFVDELKKITGDVKNASVSDGN
jgi:hypothetical protein